MGQLVARKGQLSFQSRLGDSLHNLFSSHQILTNTKKLSKIKSPETNEYLQLDYWIPELKIAFEYQDPHHYGTHYVGNESLSKIKTIDNAKKEILESRGDTLISIPYWWDGSEESLVSTIQNQRPDLLTEIQSINKLQSITKLQSTELQYTKSQSTELQFPELQSTELQYTEPSFNSKNDDSLLFEAKIPGVGELTLPIYFRNSLSFISLLSLFSSNHNSWWMCEHNYGIRACWNPTSKILYSRYGNQLDIHPQILSHFPNVFLDGEIWFGRGSLRQTLSFVLKTKTKTKEEEREEERKGEEAEEKGGWDLARMVVVDCPEVNLQNFPFEERITFLLRNLSESHFPTILAPYFSGSKSQLTNLTNFLLNKDDVSITLRESSTTYHQGRSESFLILKSSQDEKGMIMGADYASGEYTLRLPDGSICNSKIHSSLSEQPKIGDLVRFSSATYNSNGQPTNAFIQSILPSHHDTNPNDSNGNNQLLTKKVPRGYWTEHENKNIKLFFDQFASRHGFDPLDPYGWYPVTTIDIDEEGGKSILSHFEHSLSSALQQTYPEINWDIRNFRKNRNHWKSIENRREYFENLAYSLNFDPLVASSWSQLSMETIIANNGGGVIDYYNSSLVTALLDVFPSIDLNPNEFNLTNKNYWHTVNNKKKFFDSIAKEKGFDPLNTEGWYSVPIKQIKNTTGGEIVLKQYEGSFSEALMDVYPTIQFDTLFIDTIRKRK